MISLTSPCDIDIQQIFNFVPVINTIMSEIIIGSKTSSFKYRCCDWKTKLLQRSRRPVAARRPKWRTKNVFECGILLHSHQPFPWLRLAKCHFCPTRIFTYKIGYLIISIHWLNNYLIQKYNRIPLVIWFAARPVLAGGGSVCVSS